MRMLFESDSEKEVSKWLTELADSVVEDRALYKNATVTIKNVYKQGALERTKVYMDKKEVEHKPLKGKKYTALANVLDESTEVIDYNPWDYENAKIEFLALESVDVYRDYKGNVISYWTVKEPHHRFDRDENGRIQLRHEKIVLPEKWADVLMTNKIAMRINGQLYGLSDTAILSISKLMDATKTMANLEEMDAQDELAGFICAKLEVNPTELSIVSWNSTSLCKKDEKRVVKLADTIGGSRLRLWRQDELFKGVLSQLSQLENVIPKVESFQISHELSVIDIALDFMDRSLNYNLKARLEMTDTVNVATALTLVAEKDGLEFYLLRNKEGKRTDLSEDILKRLVKGFGEQIKCLPSTVGEIRLTSEKLKKLKVSIGDGRVSEMGLNATETSLSIGEYCQRAKMIKKELPPKQLIEFRVLNGELFKEAI